MNGFLPSCCEGEWTAQYVREMIENRSYITIENGWQAIADVHNAALDQEREKLRIALADNAPLLSECDQLRGQLAAERENGSYSRLHVDLAEAKAQLAHERDKVETLVDALKQLREQLAVEREKCEEPRCDFVSHLQLSAQLATLVDTLKEIAKDETIGSYKACDIARDALEKVGK